MAHRIIGEENWKTKTIYTTFHYVVGRYILSIYTEYKSIMFPNSALKIYQYQLIMFYNSMFLNVGSQFRITISGSQNSNLLHCIFNLLISNECVQSLYF